MKNLRNYESKKCTVIKINQYAYLKNTSYTFSMMYLHKMSTDIVRI